MKTFVNLVFTLQFIFFPFIQSLISQGKVYLILGSDTAIWDGMNTNKYNCYYNIKVIPSPLMNFYEVMQPSYRNKFLDSYGNHLKLTWWMMAGNIFRYADNKNIPLANSMTLYLIKKYYGSFVEQFGDELSLHYHTFNWTDYNRDGVYYWNQAKNFLECKDDFDLTLAHFLIEENIFPVSFRSGWNTMDNEWQAHLDKILPYSMHNEAPKFHADSTEPLDNIYDWRKASQEFVPYRPSPADYQLPGNGNGWNLHSKGIESVTQTLMNSIFSKANQGVDQVVCLWAHVWDENFPEIVLRIDTLARKSAQTYSNVKFKYCTAIEGMQLWRKITDFTPPQISVQEEQSGSNIQFIIQTDEKIFQPQPFLAIKDIYERFFVPFFTQIGVNKWRTINSFPKNLIAKIGIAVTDTFGNHSKKLINYLPDDIYIDNEDNNYTELRGVWSSDTNSAWGLNFRKSVLIENDSSKVKWNLNLAQAGFYNLFIQIPKVLNPAKKITFRIYSNNQVIDTIYFSDSLETMDWVYLKTCSFNSTSNNFVEMVAYGENQGGKILSADVLKISALVRKKDLYFAKSLFNFGYVSQSDTLFSKIKLINRGIEDLKILGISSKNNLINSKATFPVTVQKMRSIELPLLLYSSTLGSVCDTFYLLTDDTINPKTAIAFCVEVKPFFKIIDNEDSLNYKEFGQWNYSNAFAYGTTSRYAWLSQTPKPYSYFTTILPNDAVYNLFFIVPKTVNASNKALYILLQGNNIIDSVYLDQNLNSGSWVLINSYNLKGGMQTTLKIIDDGKYTVGQVLRADAIKFEINTNPSNISDKKNAKIPDKFMLYQNYPNPFNPKTKIKYQIAKRDFVTLKVFDILGNEVAKLVDEEKDVGYYETEFNTAKMRYPDKSGQVTSSLSSGIYFYQLHVGNFISTKKFVLLK